MGDSNHHPAGTSSRVGMRHTGGEIVEVQGGHIVRSTGRKDRHSKVCTAKGPRDRRVRLSAHTAIQFYDVQDRLGYDRPSKAVDWLIKKAKPAIDELAELPPWNPETLITTTSSAKTSSQNQNTSNEIDFQFNQGNVVENLASGSSRRTVSMVGNEDQNIQQQELGENPNANSSFLPPSLDSDSIADTIKSFFPMGASAEAPSSTMYFPTNPPDLLSRTSSHSQDLRLSLQSFQEPILLHHQAPTQQPHRDSVMFPGTAPLGGYEVCSVGWDSHPAELSRLHRMVSWSSGTTETGSGSGGDGGGGFIFGSPPQPPLQPFFGNNNQFFSQRGPLQSSNMPFIRAWTDQPISVTDTHHQHHQIQETIHHQSALSGMGFTSASGGFSGFRIPARIQGEEEHDGIHNKPSSASSDSRR